MADYYRGSACDITPLRAAARTIWEQSELSPDDVDVAIFYDHFTPAVLAQLEAFGFCPAGRAKDHVAKHGLGLASPIPVNPHGGLLGEAYIHGMNGLNEAVRQIRGTAANQVTGVQHVLCSTPPAVPASALLLSADKL
jgi:acetyl-CoA acetyltransferase